MRVQKESDPRRSGESNLLINLGIGVTGAVVLVGGAYCVADRFGHSPKELNSAGQLLSATPEVQSLSVKDLYSQSRTIDENYNDKRRSGESADKIRKDLARLTLSKVDAIESTYGGNKDYSPVKIVDRVAWVVKVRDKEFDLDNEQGLLIGGSLVEHFFREQFKQDLKDEVGFQFDSQGGSYSLVDNLLWLADHVDLAIGDVAPLAHVENLEKLSQGLQALEKTGLTVPSKARIYYYQYDDQSVYQGVGADTILLRVNSYNGEFDAQGSVGDYIVANDGQFLGGYRKNLSAALGASKNDITEERLMSPSDYADVYPDWIELGISIDKYIYDGVGFRKKIAYAEATGHKAEAWLLWFQYETIRQKLGNKDFTINGQLKELYGYQVGDVLKIDDYEGPDRSGIFLRETPTLEIDPDRPSVSDGSKIKVLEGPILVLNDQRAQATRMWKVQAGNVASGRVFIGYDGKSGWVSEEWFGQKIELP